MVVNGECEAGMASTLQLADATVMQVEHDVVQHAREGTVWANPAFAAGDLHDNDDDKMRHSSVITPGNGMHSCRFHEGMRGNGMVDDDRYRRGCEYEDDGGHLYEDEDDLLS